MSERERERERVSERERERERGTKERHERERGTKERERHVTKTLSIYISLWILFYINSDENGWDIQHYSQNIFSYSLLLLLMPCPITCWMDCLLPHHTMDGLPFVPLHNR